MTNEQLYIINAKASKIINNNNVLSFKYDYIDKETGEVIKDVEPTFSKKYTASIPPCIDNLYFCKEYRDEVLEYKKYKRASVIKKYTDAIISISFQKIYDDMGEFKMTADEARTYLYVNGFTYDNRKYVEYKRSGAKAREGKTLFIREDMLDKMIAFSNLDLDFSQDKEVDIASLRAYQSLSLSGLDTTCTNLVKIKPSEILIIEEEISVFKQKVMYTHEVNKEVVSTEKDIEIENNIWDGQCLADSSLFQACNREQFGMMLLRQRMFKACAFNTEIQQYFADNNINFVYDMWGNKKPAKQIKLIITPSCLKFLKFAYKNGGDKQTYDYWCDRLKEMNSIFGICKSEHESKMGDMHQLSYQMVNALQLSKKEVDDLAKLDIDYINNISTDIDKFVEHISKYEMSYSRQAMFTLLQYNKDVVYTKLFKDFRKNTIRSLKKKLKKGKLHVLNSDYCTVVCNPILMLKKATLSKTKELKLEDEFVGYEAYTSMYEDGNEYGAFRNPLVCTGNIAHFTNKKPSYMKYFNFTKNIIMINAIACDVLNRCQGMDMDSDTMLISDNEIIVDKAKKSQNYLTPVNGLKGDKKLLQLNAVNKAAIDNVISENAIGTVINQSQICNSYYSHKEDSNVYADICTLSSLSQLEIDKAKKYIEIDSRRIKGKTNKNLPKIKVGSKTIIVNCKKRDSYSYDKDVLAKPVPSWMIENGIVNVAEQKGEFPKVKEVFWNCGMQHLQSTSNQIVPIKRTVDIEVSKLLVRRNWRENARRAHIHQIITIKEMIAEVEKEIKAIRAEASDKRSKSQEEEEKVNEKIRLVQTELIDALALMKINTYTIYHMLKTSSDKSAGNVIKYLLLSHESKVLQCFKSNIKNETKVS